MSTFSIITPSFNQLDWLKLCIASVADQGSQLTIEHLIQDSKSYGIVELIKRDIPPRQHSAHTLSLHVEKDSGMYDALNRGITRAKGDLIAWLNSDEQYLPGALQCVHDFFESHQDIDVLFGDAILMDECCTPLSYRRIVPPTLRHTRLCHLGTLSCSTFFRRKIFDSGIQFPDQFRMIGDAILIYEILEKGFSIATLNRPLGAYTMTGENLSATNSAALEAIEWSKTSPYNSSTKFASECWHRIRKMLAGAYKRRSMDVSIFSKSSTLHRITYHCKSLDYRWISKVT